MAFKISARNQWQGKVKRVVHGVVNSEVTVELPGGIEVNAIITRGSAEQLALKQGRDVYVIVEAADVMVAVDE
jgi:molybdopterin-binding protein